VGKYCGECDGCGGYCNGDCKINKEHPGTAFCYKINDTEYRDAYGSGTPTSCSSDVNCHTENGYFCDQKINKCLSKRKDCCKSTCDNAKACGIERDNCTGNYCDGLCDKGYICNVLKGICEKNTPSSCKICLN